MYIHISLACGENPFRAYTSWRQLQTRDATPASKANGQLEVQLFHM